MHSNVQQQRPRSVSPTVVNEAGGLATIVPPPALAPPPPSLSSSASSSKQLEIMRKTAGNRQVVEKRVNASGAIPDCFSVCEKYLEKVCLSFAFFHMHSETVRNIWVFLVFLIWPVDRTFNISSDREKKLSTRLFFTLAPCYL